MRKLQVTLLALMLAIPALAAVVPGMMGDSFSEAKDYAEANNVPLVLIWGNVYKGEKCEYCEALETALESPAAKAKMRELGYVFCHVWSTQSESSAARRFIEQHGTTKLGGYPLVCAYWKRGDGTVVEDHFSGRGPNDSTRNKDYMTADQFFATVMAIVGGYGKAASFLVGNTAQDRLEAIPGKTTRVFVPLKDFKEADRAAYQTVAEFPRGGGQVTSSDQWIAIPPGVDFQPGDVVTLELLKDDSLDWQLSLRVTGAHKRFEGGAGQNAANLFTTDTLGGRGLAGAASYLGKDVDVYASLSALRARGKARSISRTSILTLNNLSAGITDRQSYHARVVGTEVADTLRGGVGLVMASHVVGHEVDDDTHAGAVRAAHQQRELLQAVGSLDGQVGADVVVVAYGIRRTGKALDEGRVVGRLAHIGVVGLRGVVQDARVPHVRGSEVADGGKRAEVEVAHPSAAVHGRRAAGHAVVAGVAVEARQQLVDDWLHAHVPQRIILRMRPVSTVPGPHSTNSSAPSATMCCTLCVQRTGLVSCATRFALISAASVWGSASTFW